MAIPEPTWREYERWRRLGFSQVVSAKKVGISPWSANKHEGKKGGARGQTKVGRFQRVEDEFRPPPGPIPFDELGPEAKRAWDDFAFFQRRYFGRIATPWQVEAAESAVSLLATDEKEFTVDNAPPGSGKSTLFTHDIPAWATVRNRAIRGLVGSKIESSASRYLGRLKNSFSATIPVQPEAAHVSMGLACPAEATLVQDFGVFRPPGKELWSVKAFTVAQHGGVLTTEKEPTWSAFGMDSGFLGMRYDLVIWDDVVDDLVLRTVESRENQQRWWDKVAEKRLDPGGLMILQGQRMGPDDLYRYCLDKPDIPDDEDLDDEELDTDKLPRKYHHIVFKAHYEDRCQGLHSRNAPYYPEGCLLDPRRVTWKEQQQEKLTKGNNYEVIYQQEDVDPEDVLINELWIKGGQDLHTKEIFPGCYDRDRGPCELPTGLHGQLLSVVTADPSPTKYWSVQWWIVRCEGGKPQERYLMDHHRGRMDAPDFLDWNNATQSFTGLMEEWQERSARLHHGISVWIVEANAAQRFMLQYEHVRRWMGKWRVRLIPHQTGLNRNLPAEKLGISCLKGVYRTGLVRLPNKNGTGAWIVTAELVRELTHWDKWRTDDCVMANWFLEWNLPHLVPREKPLQNMRRPSWLKNVDTYQRRAS